ncbi:MAG: SIS domain-containing protein [Alphaproteobacteria bacterium]|nr:SIS domain-containing protein [Alphaproteobacteria bacterium]OJV45699.1 MAG: phosphoheptose isomerase [Alphaproteobacteria bacterium 43-37]
MSLEKYLDLSTKVIADCASLEAETEESITLIADALHKNLPLLICGNGGSAADAEHISGELVGRFLKERRGYPVICLTSNSAFMTAWSNDYDYLSVFERQVEAYGQNGGILLGISTSGNSGNVVKAFEKARTMGLKTIAMTGQTGGKLAELSDVLLNVPSTSTPLIQQGHICLYHYICEQIEARLVG